MTGMINWNQIRQNTLIASHRSELYSICYWNQRVEAVNNSMSLMGELTKKQLSHLPLSPKDTVLDVGAGTGRMTIPIAKRVKHVTALEPSENMLALLKGNATKEHALNIYCINKSLEDLDESNAEHYDFVVASFSLFMFDIQKALLKMDALASKAVYLFTSASPWMDPELQCTLYGGTSAGWSDFIFMYNILHDSGILANVDICDYESKQRYDSLDEAVSKFTENYRMTPSMQSKLRDYLSSKLVEENGKLCLNSKRKAATIWWKTHK